ncbi:short-chain fatty acid transporter [Spiractinospora alimapuensis]|uniref:TIGR00366 family protein n=1 Tax=Spiractinospora alimapuensis TaxID=2820884 RepID=UPI001F1E732C|nr:TIGR00366 family protein [Spiractinospora alimapuensis]QVQ51584.1 short-chain fatty acid transporter [Spiractinospora alimapuensis]
MPKVNSKKRASVSESVANWYSRYFPDSLIFALVLTIASMVLALIFTDSGPGQVMDSWFNGFPTMFEFAFQLTFTYAAALVLVDTSFVQRGVRRVALLVRTPMAAYLITGVVGALTSFVGWYLGPIVTAIFARAVAKEMKGVDYRLISAIAYSSFVVSLTGISGTIPLFVATEGELTDMIGGIISLDQTTFSVMNLVSCGLIILVTALVFFFVARNKREVVSYADLALPDASDAEKTATAEEENTGPRTFAEKVNGFRPIILAVGLLGLGYLIYLFVTQGLAALNLNTVAFIALILGLLVQKDAVSFARSFAKNLTVTGSIVLQFPLYGGIAVLFVETGLAAVFTDALVSIANEYTFLPITFIATGLLNLFMPSAGSQFVVTAPFILPAGAELNVDTVKTIMAITYGDIWTNLIQPFWALLYYPILAAGTRLRVRDFMGYCLPILIVVGIIWMAALMFLPI